jgi:hypothetical protein
MRFRRGAEQTGKVPMRFRKDILGVVLVSALAAGLSGCEMLHELQPHRLWKLNHGTAGMTDADYSYYPTNPAGASGFLASVPDEPREKVAASQANP